jgi:hypothetical protein
MPSGNGLWTEEEKGMWKRALLAAGVLGMTFTGASTAWADPPTITTESSGGTIAHPFLGPACQNLGIAVDPVITYQSEDRITTFTNDSALVRVAYRGHATGVIVEESTGRSVDFFSRLVSVEYPAAGEATLVGVRTRYTAPGEGVLLLSAGRTTFTESGFETVGRNDRGDPEAFRDVCTYLASP